MLNTYQIWIRKYEASCSHTETIYIKALNEEVAYRMALELFQGTHAVKAVLPVDQWIPQHYCDCGESITFEERED